MRDDALRLDLTDLQTATFETTVSAVEPQAYISIAYSAICGLTDYPICGPTMAK